MELRTTIAYMKKSLERISSKFERIHIKEKSIKLKWSSWNYPLWEIGKQKEWGKTEPKGNMEYHQAKYTGKTGIMGNW